MKRFFNTIYQCLKAIVLCLRFPFLYPRNRFTDKHYNNWSLNDRIDRVFKQSHILMNPVDITNVKNWTDKYTYDAQHPQYKRTHLFKSMWCGVLKAYRWVLEVIHCIPTYTELDTIEKGWRRAFGIKMCRELKKELRKSHRLRHYRILDIKEKWGELCWYSLGGNAAVFEIERRYERLSADLCIDCGRPAKWITTGYVCPFCDEHLPKTARETKRYVSIDENKPDIHENKPTNPDASKTVKKTSTKKLHLL